MSHPLGAEVVRLRDEEKLGWQAIAAQLGLKNRDAASRLYTAAKAPPDPEPEPEPAEPEPEQEVETTVNEQGTIESKAVGRKIKTVDDLIRHIGADMTKYEVEKCEGTKWDTVTKHPETGEVTITENHRVFVRLKVKGGPNLLDHVQSMLDAALAAHEAPAYVAHTGGGNVRQALIVADPHFGKYAWAKSTGHEDYDLKIASGVFRDAAFELMDVGDRAYDLDARIIALLGDYFHYDTPGGTTTSGTPLERDGRQPLMIEVGVDALVRVIDRSAATAQTEIVLVPGNHDVTLSWALLRILQAHYRNDQRVTIASSYTARRYLRYGQNLLGFSHGDKNKKRLAGAMAVEARELWGQTTYKEIHTGHLHSKAEVQSENGVIVRTAPALCPPDDWHAEYGFVGALRAMEAYYYHEAGGLVGTNVASPDYRRAA